VQDILGQPATYFLGELGTSNPCVDWKIGEFWRPLMGTYRRYGVESTAAVFRHPIHPMLIPFPIASLIGALVVSRYLPAAQVLY
jgi:hypothetical protein